MSVVAILRLRDEIKHIHRYCKAYDWVDKIIVADVGSTDGSLEALAQYKNIELHHFGEWVERNGVLRNPEGRHINFLIELAEAQEPDWIILDDADSALSPILRNDGRMIFAETVEDVVMAHRLYIWGTTKWFPDLTGGSLNPVKDNWWGLWAWRAKLGVRWTTFDPWNPACEFLFSEHTQRHLPYPYALLHYFCLDEEEVEKKLHLYRDSGMVPNLQRWDQCCGRTEDLPEWAIPDYAIT